MARFYCPACWEDYGEDFTRCPHCGIDIHDFWDSKDIVEKLIHSLHHPEPGTPLRTAWLLGKIRDSRAVAPLIDLVRSTPDIYIAGAAIASLGEIDTPKAREFLCGLTDHPASMIREQVRRILSDKPAFKNCRTCGHRVVFQNPLKR